MNYSGAKLKQQGGIGTFKVSSYCDTVKHARCTKNWVLIFLGEFIPQPIKFFFFFQFAYQGLSWASLLDL